MRYNKDYFQTMRPGQTLIELIAVIFVISVGLVGALTLTTTNARNENIGLARLTAGQLAREGVELARNIRDTNWLRGAVWNTGIQSTSAGHCARVRDDFAAMEEVASCGADIFGSEYQLYRDANGVMTHNSGGSASTTGYYRRITLDPLCVNHTTHAEALVTSGNTCAAGEDLAGVQVRVEAGVRLGDFPVVVSMAERLYNWR